MVGAIIKRQYIDAGMRGVVLFRPKIGITMGDPAGIGPEIVVRAVCNPQVLAACRPLVIGDKDVIEQAAGFCSLDVVINTIDDSEQGDYRCGVVNLIDLHNIDTDVVKIGRIQSICGKAAFDYIERAVSITLAGQIDAIATAPINKESLRAAHIDYIGHTEILAGLTGAVDPLTMFEVRGLRVFFLSRHVSLRQACDMVTKERMLDYIARCTDALGRLGIRGGSLAVAGLNPHSGEHGLFGDEEMRHILPAIEEAQKRGYHVTGPIGADSVFHLALTGRYDAVLSLYHDQGHIATKTYDFERTIALTIGMPFLRTSVDHGTAMDIAGKGSASAVSMVEAALLAAKYCAGYTE